FRRRLSRFRCEESVRNVAEDSDTARLQHRRTHQTLGNRSMTASDQMNDPFDPATEEGTPELTIIPKGHYVARVTDAIIKPYKSGKGQAVFLTWELMDEKYEGRKVWEQYTLSHENETAMRLGRQRFKDVCDACGLSQSFKDLTLLYGKPCTIWVRVEEDPNGQ